MMIRSYAIRAAVLLLSCALFSCNGGSNDAAFEYKLIPLQKDRKWGYIDHDGKWAVNPQFDWAQPFSGGLAAVQATGGKYGFIGQDGRYAINPQYLDFTNFTEGKAFVISENGIPTCINKDGKTLFTLKDVDRVYSYRGGRARIEAGKKSGYIDATGKVCIPPQFHLAGDFTDDYAYYGIINPEKPEQNLRGFIDKDGKIVAAAQFRYLGALHEGLAYASTDGAKYGYVDYKGSYKISQQFDDAEVFSEGLAPVKMGALWGYTDKDGKLAINPQFERAGLFSGGLAPVKMDKGSWGYIDKKGSSVINPQFADADVFHNGIALVTVAGQVGMIDKDGKFRANPQYDSAYGMKDGDFQPQWVRSNLSYVESDYLDDSTAVARIVGNIFNGRGFRGLDRANTYTGVKPYLSAHITASNGSSQITDKDTVEVLPGISVTQISYKFEGIAMKETPVQNTTGNTTITSTLTGVKDNKIRELDVFVDLDNSGRLKGKAIHLRNAIRDYLIKKGGVSETPDNGNSNTQSKQVIAQLLTYGTGSEQLSFLFGKDCQYCVSADPATNTVTVRAVFADAASFAPFIKDNSFYFVPEISDDDMWEDMFSQLDDAVKSGAGK